MSQVTIWTTLNTQKSKRKKDYQGMNENKGISLDITCNKVHIWQKLKCRDYIKSLWPEGHSATGAETKGRGPGGTLSPAQRQGSGSCAYCLTAGVGTVFRVPLCFPEASVDKKADSPTGFQSNRLLGRAG